MTVALLLQALALLLIGFKLDATAPLSQPDLFWAFTLASALGTLSAMALRWDKDHPWWKHLAQLGAALLLWRLSYFPHLVFAGFLATLGEVTLHSLGVQRPPIYPLFLLALAGLHLGSVWAFGMALDEGPQKLAGLRRLLRPPQPLVAALALPALMVATMVSLSTPEDRRLLPDRPWTTPRTLPAPGQEGPNPYMSKALDPHRALPPRVLLLCAGLTFELIPHSPWAFEVKHTLRAITEAHPYASTTDRLDEHYLGYLAAHRVFHEATP